jgi:hypothetical protein
MHPQTRGLSEKEVGERDAGFRRGTEVLERSLVKSVERLAFLRCDASIGVHVFAAHQATIWQADLVTSIRYRSLAGSTFG